MVFFVSGVTSIHRPAAGGRAAGLTSNATVDDAPPLAWSPVTKAGTPALTYQRLTGAEKGYFHGEGVAAASARLVETRARIGITADWGGGLVASADGMRFVCRSAPCMPGRHRCISAAANAPGVRPG